jgi:hypothetical protein
MQSYAMDPQGQGVTRAGKVCGIVGTSLNSLGLLAALFLVGYLLLMSKNRPFVPPPPTPAKTSGMMIVPWLTDAWEAHG